MTSSASGPTFSSSSRVPRNQGADQEAERDAGDGEPERVVLGDALGLAGTLLHVARGGRRVTHAGDLGDGGSRLGLRPFDVLLHGLDGLLGNCGPGFLHLRAALEGQDAGCRAVDHGDDEGGEPVGHERAQHEGDARRQRAEGQQPHDAGATEHARADARALALLGHLGLGELDFLMDELTRLVGEALHELAERALAQPLGRR